MCIGVINIENSEHNFRIVKSPNQAAMTATLLSDKKFESYKDGDRVDISPDCWGIMDKIAKYLDKNGGTGLAIDYGQDYVQGDTLRVILNYYLFMTFISNLYNRLLRTIKSFTRCVILELLISVQMWIFHF
jgi:SAM-dependent MidA family methyltransferase